MNKQCHVSHKGKPCGSTRVVHSPRSDAGSIPTCGSVLHRHSLPFQPAVPSLFTALPDKGHKIHIKKSMYFVVMFFFLLLAFYHNAGWELNAIGSKSFLLQKEHRSRQ